MDSGDLYEYWTADGDLADPFNRGIADALAALSAQGVKIAVFHGNRDFMLGRSFARRAGVTLLAEPYCMQLGPYRVALMHGDALCTDDVKYMAYRKWSRDPKRQFFFRLLPNWARQRIAGRVRGISRQDKLEKSAMIMDVNAAAVEENFRSTGADILIHGHTHRPAHHLLTVDDKPRHRIVLADWHERAVWLEWDGERFQDKQA